VSKAKGTFTNEDKFHEAAQNGDLSLVKKYIELGVKTNYQGGRLKSTALYEAVNYDHYEIVVYLLEKGANPNITDNTGYAPINLAAYNNQSKMVQLLIKHKPDLNTQNSEGFTPLHYAVYNGNLEIVKILIEAGADSTIKEKDGYTAFDYAASNGLQEIAEYMRWMINMHRNEELKEEAQNRLYSCLRKKSEEYDDELSGAETIARAVVSGCKTEFLDLKNIAMETLTSVGQKRYFEQESQQLENNYALRVVLKSRRYRKQHQSNQDQFSKLQHQTIDNLDQCFTINTPRISNRIHSLDVKRMELVNSCKKPIKELQLVFEETLMNEGKESKEKINHLVSKWLPLRIDELATLHLESYQQMDIKKSLVVQ